MKHLDTITGYNGSMRDLAEDLGNLRYDALAKFLLLLSQKIESDGEKDLSRGRTKLASSLKECSKKLNESSISINIAWEISRPYMENEK